MPTFHKDPRRALLDTPEKRLGLIEINRKCDRRDTLPREVRGE